MFLFEHLHQGIKCSTIYRNRKKRTRSGRSWIRRKTAKDNKTVNFQSSYSQISQFTSCTHTHAPTEMYIIKVFCMAWRSTVVLSPPSPPPSPLPVFCMARRSTVFLSSTSPSTPASICMARRSTVVPFLPPPLDPPASNGRPGEGRESLSYGRTYSSWVEETNETSD